MTLENLTCPHCGEPYIQPGEQPCACGCPLPATGNSAYATDACRTRHWKERPGYVHPDSADGRNARNGVQRLPLRRPRPGGRQASLGPAIRFVAAGLVDELGISEVRAERLAHRWLARALPARQRTPRPRVADIDMERRAA